MEELANLNIAVTATTPNNEITIGVVHYLGHSFVTYDGQEQTIGTVPELLNVVPFYPAQFIYILNVGDTSVLVDSSNGFDKFPQRLEPTNAIVLSPETGTIFAVAETAPGNLWIMSVY